MKRKTILAFSGSVRKGSSNMLILNAITEIFKEEIIIDIYTDMYRLPHFNPDIKDDFVSEEVKELRKKINDADGIFICSPEYVFSIPSVLKNVLEWTVSTVVFSNKPVAFIVASASGKKAYESLDLILETLVQEPIESNLKMLLTAGQKFVSEDGKINDKQVLDKIKNIVSNLLELIDKKKETLTL